MVPYRFVHFVGVLSSEMASLAFYTRLAGCRVTASDDHTDNLYTPVLAQAGVTLFDMFAQTNIADSLEVVVVSRYLDERHPEVMIAKKKHISVMTETDFLCELNQSSSKVGVIGEYESPLITTWLQHVWKHGHISVSGPTGAVSSQTLATQSESEWFTLPLPGLKRSPSLYEPDFLAFTADMAIIPSMYYHCPDLYSTLDDVYQAYYTFAKRVPRRGVIIGNSDYPRMKRLRMTLADRHIETYGFERDAIWHIREVEETEEGTSFYLAKDGRSQGPFVIPFYGEIAVSAAVAVIVASLMHDMRLSSIGEALATLPAVKRYLETSTDREGRIIIRDGADHPETISRVITAVKTKYPTKKVWVAYEPCSFLRVKGLMADMVSALSLADTLYIGDIQGYPKEKSEGIHSRHLVSELKAKHPHVSYAPEAQELAFLLRDRVPSTDVILMLGAEPLADTICATLLPPPDESV